MKDASSPTEWTIGGAQQGPDRSIRGRLRRRVVILRDKYAGHMWQRVMHRDLAAHSLALAAQQVLCTGPLVVAVSAVMGAYGLGTVGELLTHLFDLTPEASAALASLFRPHGSPGLRTLTLSALVSLAFALSVASTTQRMLETMWAVDRAPFSAVWRQLLWLGALVPGLVAAVWAATLLRGSGLSGGWAITIICVVLGLLATAFSWWSQRLLLMGRIEWRRLLPGSLFIGLGVAGVTAGSAFIIPGQLTEQSDNYGPVGVAFVLAAWIVAVTGSIATGVLAGAVLDERKIEADERREALRGKRIRLARPSRRTKSRARPGVRL